MFREAAVAAVAMAGHIAAEAYSLQKRDGAHGHGHGHDHSAGASAPASSYEEPAASYGAPAASYGAPAASYGAPAASYGAPAASYGAPAASYGSPASSYGAPATGYGGSGVSYEEEPALPDLTPIIIGILALIGLSLLFPTYVSIVNGRRKRSTAEESNPMTDALDRVNDIYGAVVQSEECMQRIACELGGLADDFGMKETPLAKMAQPFVPGKYKEYYHQFQSGKNCQKIKCGSLF